jgi:hypothetical protein
MSSVIAGKREAATALAIVIWLVGRWETAAGLTPKPPLQEERGLSDSGWWSVEDKGGGRMLGIMIVVGRWVIIENSVAQIS